MIRPPATASRRWVLVKVVDGRTATRKGHGDGGERSLFLFRSPPATNGSKFPRRQGGASASIFFPFLLRGRRHQATTMDERLGHGRASATVAEVGGGLSFPVATALGAATEDLAVVASGSPVSVYGKRRVGSEASGLLRRPSLLGSPGNAAAELGGGVAEGSTSTTHGFSSSIFGVSSGLQLWTYLPDPASSAAA
nr:hypothetical protein Iba_chr13fCG5980 [Ipomoea batatas]GME21325.1 hypothetical protein Iba_scaffold27477CG0010 [Ipomoea batatas]